VKRELLPVSIEEPASVQSLAPNDYSNSVVIFLAGGQSCVEAAVYAARELYPGRHIVYICEPLHLSWLSRNFYENVVVIEQPFDPFGQKAAALVKDLEAGPIEACAIVIADFGFESFRFRLFALRLPTTRFYLLRTGDSALPKPMGRILFVLLAGATLLLRIILKFPGLDAFQKSIRASYRMRPSKVFGEGICMPPKAIGSSILASLSTVGSRMLRLPRAVSRSIIGLMRAICRRFLALWKGIGQRILALLARLLPPLDQPFAVGLAWLARIRGRLRFSRVSQVSNELIHVIPSIGMGGVQRQLVLLLKNRSPDYNHRVVVLRSQDRFFAPELSECGVGVYYLDSEEVRSTLAVSPGQQPPSAAHPLFKVMTSSLPFCCEIVKLSLFLRRLNPRPDIVHCWLLFANLAGSIAARLANVPLVMTSVRNIQSQVDYNYYDPRWQRALERATAPLANAITANAPAVAKDYRAFAGARDQQVVTVPNGVDIKAIHQLTPDDRVRKRQALGLGPTDLVVGTVARLAKEKDFETFLRAVTRAREKLPALRSVIVGEGPLRAHLESFASSLDLKGVVQFLGERKDVGDLIQCFDGFLLTSVIEGMPNVVMESQLLGVPVVATRAGGTVDLIREGETGLLASIGDYQALASCIVRLFAENGLWDRISLAASQQIREGYTIEQLVARTEAVYRVLLDTNADRVTVPCAG